MNKCPLMLERFAPLLPPVIEPENVGTSQVKRVPAGIIPFVPLVGVILNGLPLQVAVVNELICGAG